MKNVISVSDVQLPNGGYYTGEALDNGYGMIEISGKGKVKNPDGSSYDGSWKYGRPYGYGVYRFADGDFHKGYFDDTPNGVGYLCLNTTHQMRLGIYANGKLNGWMISIGQGIFTFGWAQNGRMIQKHLLETEWMQNFLSDQVFLSYTGNLIQISKEEYGYIRYGAPRRKNTYGALYPSIGFTFYNDGKVVIGEQQTPNVLNGPLVVCYPNKDIVSGMWENNECLNRMSVNAVDEAVQGNFLRRTFDI